MVKNQLVRDWRSAFRFVLIGRAKLAWRCFFSVIDSVLMQSQRNFSTLCRTRSKKIFSHFSWTFLSPSTSTIALWHSRVFERSLHGESIQLNLTKAIRHFRNERETGSNFANTSGIVTSDVLVSYWPIFPLSPVTVPEVFAKVNSTQFPPRF